MMDSTEERIELRESAFGRLNQLTTWIGVAAVCGVGVLAAVAWATIPGKASPPPQTASPSAPTVNTSNSTSPLRHHHSDGSVSASSGPPMAVSGASH